MKVWDFMLTMLMVLFLTLTMSSLDVGILDWQYWAVVFTAVVYAVGKRILWEWSQL